MRISVGSGYKGSSSGEISGKLAPPQGRDKSQDKQDKEPGKGAHRFTRTLELSIYHETRCQLEICGPWDQVNYDMSKIPSNLARSTLESTKRNILHT